MIALDLERTLRWRARHVSHIVLNKIAAVARSPREPHCSEHYYKKKDSGANAMGKRRQCNGQAPTQWVAVFYSNFEDYQHLQNI